MKRAESDFLSNAYTIQLERSIPFSNTQQKVLLTYYGAKADFPNPFFEDCYNYHLKMLLNRKFGKDVFQRSLSIADSMDEAGLGNRHARLKVKHADLKEIISQSLTSKELKILKNRYRGKSLYVQLNIDAIGKCWVKEITIGTSSFNDRLISTALDGKELFHPKIEEGKAVATWSAHLVRF